MYKCLKCGYEFEVDPKNSPAMKMLDTPGKGTPRIDCPKCGAKESCLPMVRCPDPKCGKYFVSPRLDYNDRAMRGQVGPNEEAPKEICPYCQTDRLQWWKEHRKKGG